jgi:RNA polymerase sigma factor (sigma-70 family)
VEASAIHHPAAISRLPLAGPLLRLRSDDQLLALFRAGQDEAFDVLHDRYRQRLYAYVRQMLGGARQDAEDVMQDVFVRAFGALRADRREMNVRAWLYRVAHNRCIDHLRRPVPAAAEVFEVSRKPLHDPIEEAQRREDLTRLVEDIGRLPEQQRSALLMRELDGMSYLDLADALDVTVPAVKSLLVRARVGLVDAAEARDADCEEIRADLASTYDRGVKASGRARRHMRSCTGCREYRTALRGVRRSFAALTPVPFGPLALAAKLLGLGGAGGGAAAGGTAAAGAGAGGGMVAAGGGVATVTACKVAAVVCTAAITAGGAVEAHKLRAHHAPAPVAAKAAPASAAVRPHASSGGVSAPPASAVPALTPDVPLGGAVLEPTRALPAADPTATPEQATAAETAAQTGATTDVATGSGGAVAPAGDDTTDDTGDETGVADPTTPDASTDVPPATDTPGTDDPPATGDDTPPADDETPVDPAGTVPPQPSP